MKSIKIWCRKYLLKITNNMGSMSRKEISIIILLLYMIIFMQAYRLNELRDLVIDLTKKNLELHKLECKAIKMLQER